MLSQFPISPYLGGAIVLLIGIVAVRREVASAIGLEKIVALGPICMAAPLGVFGAEHIAGARFIAQMVPSYMPGRLFIAYFVGCALFAAALSLTLKKQAFLGGLMLGIMIFLFVCMLHIPGVISRPHDRILWAVAFRDSSFAGAAWAFAGTQTEQWRSEGKHILITIGRFVVSIGAMFFGVEHFLHPEFAPGVPLAKVTPVWIPGHVLIGYWTGVVLFVAGASILLNKKVRMAATYLGAWVLLLVLGVYLPIMIRIPANVPDGLNYFADTLMYAGAVLLLAGAFKTSNASPS
jgi:uncharacterized membrane protein